MLAMEATGGGRDARFNLGYNMSLLSGDSSQDMYSSGHTRASSASLNPAITRSTMLPSSCNVSLPRGIKRTSTDVCFDQDRPMSSQSMTMNTDISSDLVDDGYTQVQQSKKTPPPNGKKTKGRVKIKMEYIDNKLRRYTTFSKRKTGIMKKAYELSTLTGTQVMLLVASETGHVYTFATRKLQPMITSEAGKALIQTCLNSPDPTPSSQGGDQRMSATGFEETELTYNISDEEQKDDGASSNDEYENSIGDGDADSYASGPDSPTPIDVHSSGSNSHASDTNQPTEPSQPHSLTAGGLLTPGGYPGVMYQTSNGMVYATAPPNGVIFSLASQLEPGEIVKTTSSSRSQQSSRQQQQQFITIPFPMISTASAAVATATSNNKNNSSDNQEAADLTKSRK